VLFEKKIGSISPLKLVNQKINAQDFKGGPNFSKYPPISGMHLQKDAPYFHFLGILHPSFASEILPLP
jgi:hypothetical protein